MNIRPSDSLPANPAGDATVNSPRVISSIGLLQGNVAQEMKWRPDVRARTLAGYHRMITETDARIVIIPETALPAFLDELPKDYVASLIEHGRQLAAGIACAHQRVHIGRIEGRSRLKGLRQMVALAQLNGRLAHMCGNRAALQRGGYRIERLKELHASARHHRELT